jgi:hypothetical protein
MQNSLSPCPGWAEKVPLSGKFHVQQVRDGKVIHEFDVPNGVTDVGMNAILEAMFHSGAQITTWYIGLVDNAGFSAFAVGDTMSSHAGWSESSAYANGTRPQWTCGAAATRQISNAVTVDFNMNVNATTIKGLFICGGTGANTKGGATGTLWSAAAFGSNVALNSGDVLKVTYTISG